MDYTPIDDTPLTDKEAEHPDGCDVTVSTEFARNLERRWVVAKAEVARLQEVIANALVPLRVDDNPAGMSREHFLNNCRVTAINILKKGLEIQ